MAASLNAAHVAPISQAAKSQQTIREAANDTQHRAPDRPENHPTQQGIPNKAQPALNSATAIALQTLASQEKINPEAQRQQFAFRRPEKQETPTELEAHAREARQPVSPGVAKAATDAFEKARKLKPQGQADGEIASIAIFGPNGTHPGAERGGIVNISV